VDAGQAPARGSRIVDVWLAGSTDMTGTDPMAHGIKAGRYGKGKRYPLACLQLFVPVGQMAYDHQVHRRRMPLAGGPNLPVGQKAAGQRCLSHRYRRAVPLLWFPDAPAAQSRLEQ